MIAQYTQAAMVAENRRLAAPASVDSLPDQRDAGGPRLDGLGRGAQAARPSLANLARILAVELTCAARGARPARAAPARRRDRRGARGACATRSRRPGPDRWLAPELAAAEELVASAARCVAAVEAEIGELRVSGAGRSARRAGPSSPAAAGRRRRRCGC